MSSRGLTLASHAVRYEGDTQEAGTLSTDAGWRANRWCNERVIQGLMLDTVSGPSQWQFNVVMED